MFYSFEWVHDSVYVPCFSPPVVGGRVVVEIFGAHSRKWGVWPLMRWCDGAWLILVLMNGLTTEYVDSCARQLGAKRFRLLFTLGTASFGTSSFSKAWQHLSRSLIGSTFLCSCLIRLLQLVNLQNWTGSMHVYTCQTFHGLLQRHDNRTWLYNVGRS